MHKLLMTILGIICVIVGIIGIFVPILPTTPLLLLAAWLFAKSSNRFYNYLLNNKYLSTYIKDFQETKTISLKTKIVSIVIMWISILSVILFLTDKIWVKILLLVIATTVTIYISCFKTKK